MRVVGVACVCAGLALLIGLRFAGRSERAADVWDPANKMKAGLAGTVAIIAGIFLITGGVQ